MVLNHVAPSWARLVIPFAVFAFGILGCLLILTVLEGAIQGKSWLAGLVGLLIAWFPLYVAYRGVVLVQFRNSRAAFVDDRLFIQKSDKDASTSHMVSEVVIADYGNMQIMELTSVRTGKKLLAIDYLYPDGMALIRLLRQKQGEQGSCAGSMTIPLIAGKSRE